jgi:hypothetical protein
MVYSGVVGFTLLLGEIYSFYSMAKGTRSFSFWDIIFVLAGVLHLFIFFAVLNSNLKQPSWAWYGAGPPTTENLPPGMTAEDVESQRLMSKYGQDPWSPHQEHAERSVFRSETVETFTFGPGGKWLIEPRQDQMAVSNEPVSAEKPVAVHDLGSSFAVDVFATPRDLDGVKIQAIINAISFIIPPGNNWWSKIATDKDDEGNRVAMFSLDHDVIPARGWADLWDGVLRVNLPIVKDDFFDGVDFNLLEPIARNEPAPQLPIVPGYAKRRKSIENLYYADHGDTFEVMVTVLPHMRETFNYHVQPEVLTLFFEEASRKTSEKGLRVRVKQHKLILNLPVKVLQTSPNYQLEGNAFRIWLHKA